MISIIQDKNAVEETDEEFDERMSNCFDAVKIINEVAARVDNKVKNAVIRHYNAVVSEINLSSSKSDPNRLRFLKKVRDAFSIFLSSEDSEIDQNDCPAYYIMLHFLEDGEKISHIGIDENGRLDIRIDGSDSSRAMIYAIDNLMNLLKIKYDRKDTEIMLSLILQ